MARIITKYSDYQIHSIEYFITQIETELDYRDIAGLTNNVIEKISVTKQHPLVALITSQLNPDRNEAPLASGILPAISVTPGALTDDAFTLGQSYIPEVVDSEFVDVLKEFYMKTNREIQEDVLITKKQIELILGEYNRAKANGLRIQRNEWHKNEEVNISSWSANPDIDIIIGNLIDAMLASIQVGFAGDNSLIQNFKFKTTKGLTNFNFGKTIFGSEYSLTFLNTFNNYTVYADDVLSGHDFNGTFQTVEEGTTDET